MNKILIGVLGLILIFAMILFAFALRTSPPLTLSGEAETSGSVNKSPFFPNNGLGEGVSTQAPAVPTIQHGSVTTRPGTYPSATTKQPTVNKTDTSDMDFDIDNEDLNTQPTGPNVDVDVSDENKTEQTENGNMFYITQGGTYTFTGINYDVMLTVDAPGENVQIILNGASISNSNGPAVYVRSADKVTLTLAAGSVNTLSDGNAYSIIDSESTLDGAVFSKGDLTINGNGKLIVNGNYKHGIVSKDDLVIVSGTLEVRSASAGLVGKDCVKISDGTITVHAGSDGIKSDNTEDTTLGYIYLTGGRIKITSGNDALQAQTVLKIDNVDLDVTAGGGSDGSLTSTTESFKGLKAGSDIYITGGKYNINSKDDCIHSNGTITIEGGDYTLSSGDDGIHADTDLAISGLNTKLKITKSYEGIEATNIVIIGGDISIVAMDDGINAAGGNNTTSSNTRPGRPGQNGFTGSTGSIQISGGRIHIQMNGDGLDANGTLSITGGIITVSGANSGDTAILDFDSTGTISGGTFIGTGATGMAQNFSTSSTQGAALIKTGNQNAGTTVTLKNASGAVIATYTADRAYSCVIVSVSDLIKGGSYTLTAGSYSVSFTMSSNVYSAGGSTGGPGGRW